MSLRKVTSAKWPVVIVWLAFSCTSCSYSNRVGEKGTPAQQLWYQVDHAYRTNDPRTAYQLSVDARNKLERMAKSTPTALHYSYCLALLNGRLFLMAQSLGDTNAARQFLRESEFYFNIGRKEANLPVTNYSAATIEYYIKVYDSKLHPAQTNVIP